MQKIDRPNTTPILVKIGKLYLNVAVHVQVCRLFCVVYMPLFGLVQARPWFQSSMWISSVAGISTILCTSEVAYIVVCVRVAVPGCGRHSANLNKLLVVSTLETDRKCLVSIGYNS